MNPGTGFSDLAETILDDVFESDPRRAVQLGFHEYDGRLPDGEPGHIKERVIALGITSRSSHRPVDLGQSDDSGGGGGGGREMWTQAA